MSRVEVDQIGDEMLLNFQSVIDVLEMVSMEMFNSDKLALSIPVGDALLFKFANLN